MIRFTPVLRAGVQAAWPSLSECLWPSVLVDPQGSLPDLYDDLVQGNSLAVFIKGDAKGAMVFQLNEDRICWIKYVAGTVAGGPRKRLETMREIMAWVERSAANAGCTEIKLCGRDWRVLLTEYELIENATEPNLLRKLIARNEKEAA